MYHPDAGRLPLQRVGQRGAQLKRPLGVRPDGEPPRGVQARRRGRGAQRRVQQERPRVGGAEGCRDGLRRRPAVEDLRSVGRGLGQGGAARVRQRGVGGRLPASAAGQHLAGGDGLFFAFGHHAGEAAVDHYCQDAAHGAGGAVIEPRQPPAIARRPQHAAMHHSRQPQIMHEGVALTHQRRYPPRRRALFPRRGRQRLHLAGVEELPVVERGAFPVPPPDVAGARYELAGRRLPARRRPAQQLVAGRNGRGAHRGAGLLHRVAARGKAVVRGQLGVAAAHADAARVQRQLGAADQGQGVAQALAQLHLAAEHGERAVGREAQAGADLGGHAPGQSAAVAAAARRSAAIMRLCAPHRQMLRSRAAWISARVGVGLRASSAAPAIITPLAQ